MALMGHKRDLLVRQLEPKALGSPLRGQALRSGHPRPVSAILSHCNLGTHLGTDPDLTKPCLSDSGQSCVCQVVKFSKKKSELSISVKRLTENR
jgi:hypothetical protein